MESYYVLLSRDVDLPVTALSPALAKALRRPAVEITRQLREQPWILLQDAPADALDAVFEVLVSENVAAKAVPEIHMPALPPATRVKYGEPLAAGLFLQRAAHPAPPTLPWSQLRIVSAGQVTLKPEETLGPEMFRTTPGSASMRGRGKEENHLLVDLICKTEEPLRLRIDAGDFNYDYLGDRMLSSSRENLRLLLEDICARAPDVHLTSRTERLLEGQPAPEFRFRSLEAFDAHNRWVLQAVEEAELEEPA